jgi:hypothetical protein
MLNAIQVYVDFEYIRLRLEFKELSEELADLKRIRADIKEKLQLLSQGYRHELSQLIVELFQLRRDQIKEDIEDLPEPAPEPEPEPVAPEPEPETIGYTEDVGETGPVEAETEFDDPSRLRPEEEQLLKRMFRQACKLCHPDVVAAEDKEAAEATFIALKEAYAQQDLNRVGDILDQLLQNNPFTPVFEDLADKEKLKVEIDYLRLRVRAVRREIEALKQSPPYQKLIEIDDMESYFDEMKARLRRQINRLKRKKVNRKA